MMHDVDDATLMQALRDADPLRESTLDDRERHRLEQSWREAMADSARSSMRHRVIGARGRTLQPVAAAIMAVIIIASGVLVSNVVTRRGAIEPGAGGVEGSFRAVREFAGVQTDTFLVAGGRGLFQRESGHEATYHPGSDWRGFGDITSMRVDSRMIFDGDQMYLRISADEDPFRWYRYSGSNDEWPPGLAETPQPVFEEGTRGFERVDDDAAQAKGLRRYTADAEAADLDFLGWFSPTNNMGGPPTTTVDIWVDADGRVRRMEEHTRNDPNSSITRFDQFDAVDPIDVPYPEGTDAPVAREIAGMMMYGYGDPAFADELRDRLTAEFEGDAGIAEFEIFERSATERNEGPNVDHELFAVGLRFSDDVVADVDAQRRTLDRLQTISVGELPANLSPEDGQPHGLDRQGYAALYAPGLVNGLALDG